MGMEYDMSNGHEKCDAPSTVNSFILL